MEILFRSSGLFLFFKTMRRRTEERQEARATQIRSVEASNLGTDQGDNSNPNLFPVPIVIPAQAKNQLLNSDYSHSVMTWNDPLPNTGGNRNEEAAWWFSNTAPVVGQVLATAVTP